MSSSVNSLPPRQNETTNYREQFPLKQSNTLTAAALEMSGEPLHKSTNVTVHKNVKSTNQFVRVVDILTFP